MADNDDIRKVNTKSLRLESRGDEYVETFLVTGLTSPAWEPWDAYNQASIPHKGDLKNDIDDTGTLICTHVAVEPMESSTGGDYTVEVTWSSPSGNTIPDTDQAVYWSIGTQAQRVDVSFDGAPIGTRSFWGQGNPNYPDPNYGPTPHYDEDADLGATIAVPTVEFEVVLPKTIAAGYACGPAAVAELAGTVNTIAFSVGAGTPPTGPSAVTTFSPGFCLFQGASIEPSGTNANVFRTTYRFTAGMAVMPSGVPQVEWNNETKLWQQLTPAWVVLPIRYGYAPIYKGFGRRNVAPEGEDPDYQEYEFTFGDFSTIDNYVKRELLGLAIWEAYPRDADTNYTFADLGIWAG